MAMANVEELLYVVEEVLTQNGKDISAEKVAKLNDQWSRQQITVDALGFELAMVLVDAQKLNPIVE